MHAPLTRCSRDYSYLWVNQPYADWLGRPLHKIAGRRIVDVLGSQAFQALKDHFDQVLAGQKVVFDHEVVFDHIGRGWISAAYSPTFDSSGIVDGCVAVVQDVTPLKRAGRAPALKAPRVFTRRPPLRNRLPTENTVYWPLTSRIILYLRSSLLGIMAVSPGSTRFPAPVKLGGRSLRVLIVDDHEVVRKGVRSLLSSADDVEICGEAVDGRDAIAKAQQLKPDVITMDISMPNLNGLDATREIRRILPDTSVLIMSQHDVPEMMRQALNAGAKAYVVKSAISTQLIAALERVKLNDAFFDGTTIGSNQQNLDAHDILQRTAAFERALRDSEERFRLTFEQAAVGMAHVDPEGRWLRVNRKLCQIVGYTQEEMRGLTFQEITHPEDLAADLAQAERVVAGEIDEYFMEKRYIHKSGNIIWINLTVAAVRDLDRKLKYFVSVVEDITSRKTAEVELLDAKRALQRTAASLAAEALALAKLNDLSSRLWHLEKLEDGLDEMISAAIDLLGASKGNIQLLDPQRDVLVIAAQRGLERDFLEQHHEIPRDHPSAACARALRSANRVIIEDVEADPDCSPLLHVTEGAACRAVVSTPLIDTDGNVLGIISTYFSSPHRPTQESLRRLDLYAREAAGFIQRSKTEIRVRESEDHFRAIFDTTPECVKLIAPDGTLLHMNSPGLRMLGAESCESVVGKSVYDLIAPHDRGRFRGFNETICKGQKGALEYDIVSLLGTRRHMESHSAPLRRPDGSIVHLAVTRDTTGRKRAEEAQHRLASIVESSDDAIISKDLNGIITTWNAGAEQIFGFTAREAIGQPVSIIIPPELQDEEAEILARLRRGQPIHHYDTIRRTKSGARRHMSLTISPLRDSHGRIVGASKIARDITERRRAERALKEAELAGRLLQLQDEERRHIARELHDSVGQQLAALNMNTSNVSKEKEKLSESAAHSVEENLVLVRQVLEEIRTLSHLLHPPLLDEIGLGSALTEYVDGFVERSKIQVRLELPQDLERLPREYELSLFRIVQECLTNIHRHSGSSTAVVRLSRTPEEITLEVSDQGRGIDPETQERFFAGRTSGVGLRGMRERVRQIGGALQIQSTAGGTTVLAILPSRFPTASPQAEARPA
jgi:PAS domain S-box-containing protein